MSKLAGHAARAFTIHALGGVADRQPRRRHKLQLATVAGRARITFVPDARRVGRFTG